MSFLVIFSVSHLAQVFFELIRIAIAIATVKIINNVNSKSWVEVFSSLFLDIVVATFFLFFFDLLNGLLNMQGGCQPSFLDSSLKFLNLKIFHKDSLIDSLITFYKLFAISNVLVHLSENERGQRINFSLDIDDFLYQLFSIIQFLVALLYLSFN